LFSLYASFIDIDLFQCHQQQTNMDNIPKKNPQRKNFIGAIIKGQCMSFIYSVSHSQNTFINQDLKIFWWIPPPGMLQQSLLS